MCTRCNARPQAAPALRVKRPCVKSYYCPTDKMEIWQEIIENVSMLNLPKMTTVLSMVF